MLSVAERAWLAGFFDGEGCWTIAKHKPNTTKGRKGVNVLYQPHIIVVSTDPRPIKWIQDKMGIEGGKMVIRNRKNNWKDAYIWKAYSKNMVAFTNALLPYLKIKKEVATITRDLQISINNYKTRKSSTGRGRDPLPANVIAERELMYQQVRLLNRKGKASIEEI